MSEFLLPTLIGVLVAGLLYRRIRRLFGRQRVTTRKLIMRITVVGSLALLFVLMPGGGVSTRILGIVLGVILAAVGMATMRVERQEEEWFYTPNKYLGFVIVSIILGRFIYRLSTLSGLSTSFNGDSGVPESLAMNPTGRVLLLTLLVYYGVSNAGVLRRCRQLGVPPRHG